MRYHYFSGNVVKGPIALTELRRLVERNIIYSQIYAVSLFFRKCCEGTYCSYRVKKVSREKHNFSRHVNLRRRYKKMGQGFGIVIFFFIIEGK
nr:MAG TPA: GYF domain 2 [Caudoviricetes sp.]